ncbi:MULTISPECIES: PRC-barrel domain-containing protein [unclassified Beijerinckia]|uniref:PRC-barrel domain-containing protein n=1 Tax=unclassified Beijerinckia TaxID=2638183 RepID=UPI0008942E38|nr:MULTISPECIES: PRC-barrel domain-containing protein [unclassified Beijerinckia]MDH7797755.1 sporulation protein YlmC with PRC-barrel domain [Beijerinckia sp. GAS462]SEC97495.1 Sporulation protein YlmC, PRC-barrel domain family [Beijerinckia sp. 28-YEA-48]
MLKSVSAAALLAILAGGSAIAQSAPSTMSQAPASNYVTTYSSSQSLASGIVNKNVYDPKDEKIGEVNDLLLDRSSGAVAAAVIGVGGFLGIGEKNIAVPFQNIKVTMKDDKERLVLNTTKEELKTAPEFKVVTPARPGSSAPTAPGLNPPPDRSTGR